MAFEAHKCNEKGCEGFIVFDNADFNYSNPPIVNGMYEFDDPKCTECGKEYKVVLHHAVIAVDEDGDVEFVESASITDFEKREKQRKFETELNPHTKVLLFLEQRGYTYTVEDVIKGYLQRKEGCYVSHTMKDCIRNLELEITTLLNS